MYIGEHVYQQYDHVEAWFGIVHPTQRWLPERAQAHNSSADSQWQFAATARHPGKFAFFPHPDYLAARAARPEIGLPLPSMTVQLPRIAHSVSLFYIRSWQPMATALAWLLCSAQPDVRSPAVLLNGSWSSPTTQASVTVVYAAPRVLHGPDVDPGPDCYDRLILQMQDAGDFRVVGYAVA